MTSLHKDARFELVTALLVVVAVAILYAWSGRAMASMAGFSLLALSGVRTAVRSARGDSGEVDERDEIITQRASVAGYTVFWIAFVAWGLTVTLRFGADGFVPIIWVAPVLWVAWWLVTVVRSITVLVLERQGV